MSLKQEDKSTTREKTKLSTMTGQAFFKLTIPAVVALLVLPAWSQTLSVTGNVVDEKSKTPVAFATVSVMGHPVGTVTNANGEFDFHMAQKYANDSLMISHVGYQSYKGRIADLAKERLAVALTPRPVLLNEVIIHEKNLTAREIVAKAVNSLTLNYATNPYCMQGFFREIEEVNGRYVLLSEAAVDLYDKNFDGKPKRHFQEAVDVREMRRSLHTNGNPRDNIGMALADLIENNDVRYNRGMLNLTGNTFLLDTVMQYQDRPVFGITMMNRMDSGTLYIDAETYGFVKVSMERKSRDKAKKYYHEDIIRDGQRRGLVWFRYAVEFETYDGKLYPRRMHESELVEFYDAATGKITTAFIETLEFIVMAILPGKENANAKRLKYGMEIKTSEYHPEFWKTYNTLKLTPVDEKLIQDLEEEISLEKQFEQQHKGD